MSEQPSSQLTHAIHLLDQLNTQIGITGALVVDQYHKQRQAALPPPQPTYYPYPPQPMPYSQQLPAGYPPQGAYYPPPPPGYAPTQYPPSPPLPQPANPPVDPQAATQSQIPPIAQDFASLANILTQTQYDLFDINVTLAQDELPQQLDSRIDDKAIAWLTDIITKISSQLPAHQDPILPIGNQIANNFYLAKNLAQQVILALDNLTPTENQSHQFQLHKDYVAQLQSFMFTCFRWSNLVLKEKDWYWKPKSQMQEESAQQASQTPLNSNGSQSQTIYSNNSSSYQSSQDQTTKSPHN